MRAQILLAVFLALLIIVRKPGEAGPYMLLAAVLLYLLYRAYIARYGSERQRAYWASIDTRLSTDTRLGKSIVLVIGVIVLVGIVAQLVFSRL